MNSLQNSDTFQQLLRFGFRASGYVVTVGLVACLILAWILTAPLLRCGVYLSDAYRKQFDIGTNGKIRLHRWSDKHGHVAIGRQ